MSRTSASKAMTTIAGIGVVALVLSACGGSSDGAASSEAPASNDSSASAPAETGGSEAPATSEEGSSEETSSTGGAGGGAVEGDDDVWCDTLKSTYGDITGKTISIATGITGEEGTNVQNSFKTFVDCTGAVIQYNADKGFEAQVVQQVSGGNAPDIAFVPQPGLLKTLVQTGKVIKSDELASANVDKYWDSGWKTFGSIDGTLYAAPLGANVKSLVWYSPKTFEAGGYEVPTTWDEMIALSDKIVAEGKQPWCAGIESGSATGWHATDWLEEVVMRKAGPDVYQQWITGEVKFTDQPIVDSLGVAASIWKNPDYVNAGIGDVTSIATTPWADGGLPVQTGECTLFQAANFMQGNWKNDPVIAEDGDLYAFYLPAIGDEFGKPVEVGGEFVAAFREAPEVQAFQYYLTTAHWANEQSKAASSRISANKGLLKENAQGPINQLSVDILQDKDAVSLFDASDLMPSSVGAGSMWSELTQWIVGQDDATTLQNIQNTWPS